MIKNAPYKIFFPCDNKDIIYILIWMNCDDFYLGQTQDFKQRTAKHKSNVKNLHNSTCRICSEHRRDCNQAKPYFQIFQFYYETNTAFREYKEKQSILRWKPPLNLNKTWIMVELINYFLIGKFWFVQ